MTNPNEDMILKGQDDLIRRGEALAAAVRFDGGVHTKISARIAALPAVQPQVTVKPLVWNSDNEARGVGCFYTIWGDREFKVSINGSVLGGILYGAYRQVYTTIADAKAAAQDDYEARILSAIVEGKNG